MEQDDMFGGETLPQVETQPKTVWFEQFWAQYPRALARKDCFAKFCRKVDSEEEFARLMASLAVWKQSDQWQQKQYIPHSLTWLNQERWRDDASAFQSTTATEQTLQNIDSREFEHDKDRARPVLHLNRSKL